MVYQVNMPEKVIAMDVMMVSEGVEHSLALDSQSKHYLLLAYVFWRVNKSIESDGS